MRVIVTRPPAQAADWVAQLQALGVDAVAVPLIGIAPLDDPSPLQAAWAALPGTALVMFVSANAVAHFFAARPPGATWPAGTRAGSTGPGTSAALRQAGLTPQQIVAPADDAPVFDSEALWALLAHDDWAGRRALVVRGEDGRDWFAETLRARGAEVGFVAAYRRLPPELDGSGRQRVAEARAAPQVHLWLFSSSEAVGHLRRIAPGADWSAARAVASHPRIAQAARDAGFGAVDLLPPSPAALAAWLGNVPSQPLQPLQGAPIQSAPQ
ncbi:uroporphyrinogen-III synthase [Rubrivivax sp. RP6-9]|uniref:uroporphyrinogen-III synthase n=1 Tax=Rubrivivax sp. RP6-9 TaxID=3415750 RepID=UPI003CC5B875